MKRRGFTLIELLTVIGIIAVLVTMLVIGIGKLQNSAKRRTTEQILASAQAMYSEYDAAMRPTYRSIGAIYCPQNVTTDLASANDRYGANVIFTRDIMALLRGMPANSAALGKMPADEKMTLSNSLSAPGVWVGGGTAPGPTYAAFARVSYPSATSGTYICIQANISSDGSGLPAGLNAPPANAPGNTAYWMPETNDPTVPILLDAWGNPIIFVPSALGINGASPGQLTAGGQAFSVSSPDGRPFFASAGPDGDFSKGDDNIYSFEK